MRRCRTVASWCSRSSRCVSACTISSTRSRPGCRRRKGTAARSRWTRRPDARCWPARSTSPGARRASGRCKARAGGRLSDATAAFWAARWRDCLRAAGGRRAARRAAGAAISLASEALREDIAFVDGQIEQLLADSAGQILTTLPGVATVRAAAFAAHTLPIERFATPEHLYSATGLAPASYESATVRAAAAISPHRPARAPRRADGHRLGPGPVRARLPAAPRAISPPAA